MGASTRRRRLGWLVALLALGFGCTTVSPGMQRFDYFTEPHSNDPWSRKIQRWQQRELSERGDDGLPAPAAVAEPGGEGEPPARDAALPESLQAKYAVFRADQKREIARQVATWVQDQARLHYVADGPVDRWATLAETLRHDGDDCDGLELLTLNLLRELGFDDTEVYRGIVYRRSDGQHHMVTLWFENPDDPWVIDPTGAMTLGMPRMSEVPGWVPLKVFSEDQDYTVQREIVQR